VSHARAVNPGRTAQASKAFAAAVFSHESPTMPNKPDGPDYESVIDDLAEKLDAWRNQDAESADSFARRIVGLLRMAQAKWQARL
jgi:hypothetical protein